MPRHSEGHIKDMSPMGLGDAVEGMTISVRKPQRAEWLAAKEVVCRRVRPLEPREWFTFDL